jgi:hypothetical protein
MPLEYELIKWDIHPVVPVPPREISAGCVVKKSEPYQRELIEESSGAIIHQR